MLATEYQKYHGKTISRRPDREGDAPSEAALARRHKRFLEAQKEKVDDYRFRLVGALICLMVHID
jgi:hypothetical protein